MTAVNPLSITEAEEPYLGMSPSQVAAVARQLLEHESTAQVQGLIGWLTLKTHGIDHASAPSRARYRGILRDRAPVIPPPTRGERRAELASERGAGGLALITNIGGASFAMASAAGHHPVAAGAVMASLVITNNGADCDSEPGKAGREGRMYTLDAHRGPARCAVGVHELAAA